jgi:hypothetical protein
MSTRDDYDELLKTLCVTAILNDNLVFAKKIIELIEVGEGFFGPYSNDGFVEKNMLLNLQFKSCIKPIRNYGVPVCYDDNYDTIYEKIHVNIFFKLVEMDNTSDDTLATQMLKCYNGNIISLKRSIMLCLVRGNNGHDPFAKFVRIADILMSTGLDLNYSKLTYEGFDTSPLKYAKDLKYNNIAKYLIAHGAKDTDGETHQTTNGETHQTTNGETHQTTNGETHQTTKN